MKKRHQDNKKLNNIMKGHTNKEKKINQDSRKIKKCV